MAVTLNKYSSRITQPKSQGASQAMLYGTGLTDRGHEQGRRSASPACGTRATPATCTSTTWPTRSRKGCRPAGLVGMRFNTIGVSDGISMGTEGMSYSLQSRDLIADSIETVMGAQWYDALHRASRLRQEHARLRDGDGPAQPARRSWSTAARSSRAARRRRPKLDIVSAFQCLRRIPRRHESPKKNAQEIVRCSMSRRRRVRRHVHRQHDGLGDRSARHVAAVQLVDPGRRSRTSSTSASRPARRSATCSNRTSSRATS